MLKYTDINQNTYNQHYKVEEDYPSKYDKTTRGLKKRITLEYEHVKPI
jgi:hypothetical protein